MTTYEIMKHYNQSCQIGLALNASVNNEFVSLFPSEFEDLHLLMITEPKVIKILFVGRKDEEDYFKTSLNIIAL